MSVRAVQVDACRRQIQKILDDEAGARKRVGDYFDDASNYASVTFNTVGANEPDSIGPDDLLAVHLLSVDITPKAARALLEDGQFRDDALGHLSKIDPVVCLWEPGAVAALAHAEALWVLLKTLRGVDWVIAGKILARKRPHLIPIADALVWEYFQPEDGDFWETMRLALMDGWAQRVDNALRIDSLKSDEMREMVSTLRLLDVAVWMLMKG